MHTSPYVPSFYFYKFADAISSSYTSLNSYRSGVIDANGNVLKPESSIDPFEYLVIKIKKIIDQLPYGMTKASLGNFLSAINYFGEEVQKYDITKDQFDCMMEGIITLKSNNKVSYLELMEDMSVGGGGGGAGSLGTPMPNSNESSVAGFDPVLGMKLARRKPKYQKGIEVFEVDPEEFMQFKIANNWDEVPEGDNKKYLNGFQKRNKGTKIAVKSVNPLNGEQDLHWINYPAKNFLEEFDLRDLSFLFEEIDNSEIGKQKQQFGREFHEKFGSYLSSLTHSEGPNQGKPRFKKIEPPEESIRKDPELLKKFHDEMEDNSFYVGGSNEGYGHDAFVRVNKDVYGGFELKGLQEPTSPSSSRKRELTPVTFGPTGEGQVKGAQTAIQRGIEAAGKRLRLSPEKIAGMQSALETFRTNAESKLSQIFKGVLPARVVSQFAQSHGDKLRREREEIYLVGGPTGLDVLSTAEDTHTQHGSTEKIPHPIYSRHENLIKEIGLELGGLSKTRTSGRMPRRKKKNTNQNTGVGEMPKLLSRIEYQRPEDPETLGKIQRNAERIWGKQINPE